MKHILIGTTLVLILSPTLTRAQTVIYSYPGDATRHHQGRSVRPVPDVDGDDITDFILGGTPIPGGGPIGTARVYSGASGSLLLDIVPPGTSGYRGFGWSVDGIGDIDGDGAGDLIVGIPWSIGPQNLFWHGKFGVYSGATGATLYTFGGDAGYDRLGYSVSAAGDVDGDSVPDFVAGAAYGRTLLGSAFGYARVYSGSTGAVLYTFWGPFEFDNLGWSVAGAGDVNGDGFADIIAGAPQATGPRQGYARIYSGFNGVLLYQVTGDSVGDAFGWEVGPAGDLDNDGYDDFIVGAPQAGYGNGYARVYSGANGSMIFEFRGDAAGDQFGAAVNSAGDLDRDGINDLIVGAVQPGSTGYLKIFSGADGSLLRRIAGEGNGDHLGHSVSELGDVNLDGFPEFLAGAVLSDEGGTDSGKALVFSGCPGSGSNYGSGCSGSGGFTPALGLQGCPAPGSQVSLSVSGGLGGTTGFLLIGSDRGQIDLGNGCFLLVDPLIGSLLPLVLSGSGAGNGTASLSGVLPPDLLPLRLDVQVLLKDGGVPQGFSMTNGVEILIP